MTTEKTTSVQQYILIAVVVIAAFVLLAPKATDAKPQPTPQINAEIAKLKVRIEKLEAESAGNVGSPVCQCEAEVPAPYEPPTEATECVQGTCDTQPKKKLFSRLRWLPRLRLFKRR